MSTDRWRWAQKAHQLRFHQLDTARRQAESWRTGLAGLTTLLGAVLIVKGRDNFSTLAVPYRWLVVGALGVALGCLVWASLLAIRAASGTPSDECLLTGEDLQEWTRLEVAGIQRAITRAGQLTLVAVCVIALAVGFTWLGPTTGPTGSLVVVEFEGTRLCGALVGTDRGNLIVATGEARSEHRIVPLVAISRLAPADNCQP
ncbi:hypothetical protein GCM10027290_48430 [Micromonospora sonneratiae]|uniref:Uncharacterized protein n=1 Tax=Micromonospora sonneratiae TaxID=1184706 RepID=A0ABW3YKX6_9ACTN